MVMKMSKGKVMLASVLAALGVDAAKKAVSAADLGKLPQPEVCADGHIQDIEINKQGQMVLVPCEDEPAIVESSRHINGYAAGGVIGFQAGQHDGFGVEAALGLELTRNQSPFSFYAGINGRTQVGDGLNTHTTTVDAGDGFHNFEYRSTMQGYKAIGGEAGVKVGMAPGVKAKLGGWLGYSERDDVSDSFTKKKSGETVLVGPTYTQELSGTAWRWDAGVEFTPSEMGVDLLGKDTSLTLGYSEERFVDNDAKAKPLRAIGARLTFPFGGPDR